jgi:hypothetical protein
MHELQQRAEARRGERYKNVGRSRRRPILAQLAKFETHQLEAILKAANQTFRQTTETP